MSMSTQFQSSNFLDVKVFFTDCDVKNIADLISNYIIKDAVENEVTLTYTDINKILDRIWWRKDIREYIHNTVWEKLYPNKTFLVINNLY
jgi:hypothetical protein